MRYACPGVKGGAKVDRAGGADLPGRARVAVSAHPWATTGILEMNGENCRLRSSRQNVTSQA